MANEYSPASELWPDGVELPSVYFSDVAAAEDNVRSQSEDVAADALFAWREGVSLLAGLFYPEINYDFAVKEIESINFDESKSFEYRVHLASVAVRASQSALHLAVSGYYSQSLGILRNVYEIFRRMLFTRVFPEKVYRFYPEELIGAKVKSQPNYIRYHQPKIEGDEWRALSLELEKEEHYLEKVVNQQVRANIEDLHAHAHPGFEGTFDMFIPNIEGRLNLRSSSILPRYHLSQLELCVRHGLKSLSPVMLEAGRWGAQLDGWEKARKHWFMTLPWGDPDVSR